MLCRQPGRSREASKLSTLEASTISKCALVSTLVSRLPTAMTCSARPCKQPPGSARPPNPTASLFQRPYEHSSQTRPIFISSATLISEVCQARREPMVSPELTSAHRSAHCSFCDVHSWTAGRPCGRKASPQREKNGDAVQQALHGCPAVCLG